MLNGAQQEIIKGFIVDVYFNHNYKHNQIKILLNLLKLYHSNIL